MPHETCGLYIDLWPTDTPIAPGDYIATSRSVYLVATVRVSQPRKPRHKVRFMLRCYRSTRGELELGYHEGDVVPLTVQIARKGEPIVFRMAPKGLARVRVPQSCKKNE